MVYYDDTGRRIHRTIKRRNAQAADPDIQLIQQIAAENPRFTPDEVYEEIRKRRSDISRAMVCAVLIC